MRVDFMNVEEKMDSLKFKRSNKEIVFDVVCSVILLTGFILFLAMAAINL